MSNIQEYSGQHTGPQIDAAIDRVLKTPGDDAISYADVGAAPAGFGLGVSRLPQVNRVELDALRKAGWCMFYDTSNPLDYGIRWALISVSGENTGITDGCVQTMWTYDGFGNVFTKVERHWNGSSWSPLYVDNPPMVLGVEYRTTERWLGKPVYIKMVEMGSLPNNARAAVDFTSNIYVDRPIACGGSSNWVNAEYATALPFSASLGAHESNNIELGCSAYSVHIRTYTDQSARSAQVWVKYWKTTD